jgi:hypothetical protein
MRAVRRPRQSRPMQGAGTLASAGEDLSALCARRVSRDGGTVKRRWCRLTGGTQKTRQSHAIQPGELTASPPLTGATVIVGGPRRPAGSHRATRRD